MGWSLWGLEVHCWGWGCITIFDVSFDLVADGLDERRRCCTQDSCLRHETDFSPWGDFEPPLRRIGTECTFVAGQTSGRLRCICHIGCVAVMFQTFIECRSGNFRFDAVDGFVWLADAIEVGSESDNGSEVLASRGVSKMQANQLLVCVAIVGSLHPPKT